jgi:hypothetical protein
MEDAMPYPEGRLLRLPSDILLKLELHLGEYHHGKHFEDHLTELMTSWLADDLDRVAELESRDCQHGYQWKEVFLVDRTLLRTCVNGRNYIAEVQFDDLIFNGQRTSPSRFANQHGVSGRNAWECLLVKQPGSKEWIRAKRLRTSVPTRSSKTI